MKEDDTLLEKEKEEMETITQTWWDMFYKGRHREDDTEVRKEHNAYYNDLWC